MFYFVQICDADDEYNETDLRYTLSHYLHLATSEMWCWSGGRGTLIEVSLCYSTVYYYNGAQWYEQFISLSSKCLCVFGLHGAI